jgi:hypothetical protein
MDTHFEDITSTTFTPVNPKPGWFIRLSLGEKNLSDSTVFGGMVLFTTFTPLTGIDTDPCVVGSGTGRLYAMAMMPITINGIVYNAGAGLFADGNRSIDLGTGIPTSPVISQKPKGQPGGTDVYVSVSGSGGTEAGLWNPSAPPGPPPPDGGCPPGTPAFICRLMQSGPQATIIHWKDRRL